MIGVAFGGSRSRFVSSTTGLRWLKACGSGGNGEVRDGDVGVVKSEVAGSEAGRAGNSRGEGGRDVGRAGSPLVEGAGITYDRCGRNGRHGAGGGCCSIHMNSGEGGGVKG